MGDGIDYELLRLRVGDDTETTVYLVRHPLADTSVRVVHLPEPVRLDHWCAANDQPEAMVAGFFVRDPYRPLGEVRIGGTPIEHEPIDPPGGPSAAVCTATTTACASRHASNCPTSQAAISCRPARCSCPVVGR